jgi:CheY-like chemotaxis protein
MMQSDYNNNINNEDRFLDINRGKKKSYTSNYFIIALLCLIIAVILITFNLRLIAGILIISAVAMLILDSKKNTSQVNMVIDSGSNPTDTSLAEKKHDIISDFSHRIREPLNNMVIIGELLLNTENRKKQRELLETLQASANNMVTTMNELTMQSADIIKEKKGEKIRYNILSTIQNTIDLYNQKERSVLDIIFSKKDVCEFECVGDPVFVKQIFLDLFNTIEMQTERKTKVTIGVKKEDESNRSKNISFRIQTDKKMQLIEEENNSIQPAVKLINNQNGTYDLETGSHYSVLTIVLPFENAPLAVTGNSHDSSASVEREKIRKEIENIKVLLVEDNLITQKITLLALKHLVKSIDTATNGQEALDRLSASEYDLILLDIQMPVMDGILAAEKIRQKETGQESHIPIIAITADAMIGDKERCISAGIDDYISKPFQPSVLIEKIKTLI